MTIEGVDYISSKRAAEITGYAQDYVGQLARSGKIEARRVGGLWYVIAESILAHKKVADEFVPEPPVRNQATIVPAEDASLVNFDGKTYVSAARAAKLTSYHQDYIGQLARSGKILSKQVGRRWYVDLEALKMHKKEKDSLLAAVQSEAVGIRQGEVSVQSRQEMKDLDQEVGLHYTYFKDSKPLLPIVPSVGTNPEKMVHNMVEFQAKNDEEGRPVPIRVLYPSNSSSAQKTSFSKDGTPTRHIPKISMFSRIFSVTIILIASVFIFNLNVVAVPDIVKSASGSPDIRNYEFAQISNFEHLGSRILEYLVNLLSSEQTYTRQ